MKSSKGTERRSTQHNIIANRTTQATNDSVATTRRTTRELILQSRSITNPTLSDTRSPHYTRPFTRSHHDPKRHCHAITYKPVQEYTFSKRTTVGIGGTGPLYWKNDSYRLPSTTSRATYKLQNTRSLPPALLCHQPPPPRSPACTKSPRRAAPPRGYRAHSPILTVRPPSRALATEPFSGQRKQLHLHSPTLPQFLSSLTSAASCAFVSAPPCTSLCTTSIFPDTHAACSGVCSNSFLRTTSPRANPFGGRVQNNKQEQAYIRNYTMILLLYCARSSRSAAGTYVCFWLQLRHHY